MQIKQKTIKNVDPIVLLDVLCGFDKKCRILKYFKEHSSGRYVIGTVREIAKSTDLSNSTVLSFLQTLETNNLLVRKGPGIMLLTLPEEVQNTPVC